MAQTRNVRIDGNRMTALATFAQANGTDVTKEIVAAIEARIAVWRAGDLAGDAGDPVKVFRSFRISDELWDALDELAHEQRTDRAKEIIAAIDERIAAAQESPPPSVERVPRKRKPHIRETADEAATGSEPATPDARMCPPHPKARVHKGFCGACGKPVAQG